MKRIALATSTAESFATFLRGQARSLSQHFDVTIITSPGPLADEVARAEGVRLLSVDMPRAISPTTDLTSIARLARDLKRAKIDLVHSYTPKAGLVAMLASARARVPHRFHSWLGWPLDEAKGARRLALAMSERMTARAATRLFANSFGLRDRIPRWVTTRRVDVIANGSVNGIDLRSFEPPSADERTAIRAKLGLAEGDVAFVFVGRLVRDKGVVELASAFERLRAEGVPVKLILVGAEDPADPLPMPTRTQLAVGDAILRTGFVRDVRPFLRAADVMILPSYREGLPNALLESGAMGLPAIATDITGCNEVVQDGTTGFLVPAKDPPALADRMRELALDRALRARLSSGARCSIAERYDQDRYHAALLDVYQGILGMTA